jgi:hypothetical protein
MDKKEITEKVLFASLEKKVGGYEVLNKIVSGIRKIVDAVTFIKKNVDIEKLITGGSDSIFSFLPLEKLLICFDDIERMSDKYKINDFLGLVNELVENKKCKVLLIANYEYIVGKENMFKEKTIEKTIHFAPDLDSVFDNIINFYDVIFKDYLSKNKAFILDTLVPKLKNKEGLEELEKNFANIRTLKFAIEHFKYAFTILEKDKKTNDELRQKQLKNIWFFTLAISNEFKKPVVSLDNFLNQIKVAEQKQALPPDK